MNEKFPQWINSIHNGWTVSPMDRQYIPNGLTVSLMDEWVNSIPNEWKVSPMDEQW